MTDLSVPPSLSLGSATERWARSRGSFFDDREETEGYDDSQPSLETVSFVPAGRIDSSVFSLFNGRVKKRCIMEAFYIRDYLRNCIASFLCKERRREVLPRIVYRPTEQSVSRTVVRANSM